MLQVVSVGNGGGCYIKVDKYNLLDVYIYQYTISPIEST